MSIFNSKKFIIGVDEVGRGPLAGPVAVGAFVFLDEKIAQRFRGVKDSKQLTHEIREKFFAQIVKEKEKGNVNFAVTFVGEKVIDEKGLSFAIKSALATSLSVLSLPPTDCLVLLDGGLKAPKEYSAQKTIIKGDEKKKVIALASIAAKVMRDRKMCEFAELYKGYNFESHKGYGTREHRLKIKELGLCPLHRRSFLKRLT